MTATAKNGRGGRRQGGEGGGSPQDLPKWVDVGITSIRLGGQSICLSLITKPIILRSIGESHFLLFVNFTRTELTKLSIIIPVKINYQSIGQGNMSMS